jgi:uncharacterized 2Fe-2S/4Fe-4S cluster protein (DUF4445 family)
MRQDDGTFKPVESCQLIVDGDISIKISPSSIASSFIMDKAGVFFPETFRNQFGSSSSTKNLGFAIDLGTTTIAIYLCNISRGELISAISVKNPQAIYGDDVMSRIGMIGYNPENLGKLQALVIKGIEWGMKKLLSSSGGDSILLSNAVVVGNPAMIHIFAGIDPASIGVSPYKPVLYDSRIFQSEQLGFSENAIKIRTLPNVSGFIGGDILAASMAVEMKSQPDGTLLIDLGTNGELLLKSGRRLYATSCATGPAFEGATLSCGMQAVPGAITSIKINDKMEVSEISVVNPAKSNRVRPSGICGPGVVNAVAQLSEKQFIRPDGAFSSGAKKFVLIPGSNDTSQAQIFISQKDIRSVQLGKSALFSGIEFLLKKARLKRAEKIIIAGAFGSHLNKSDLIRLGMIPKIDPDKIEVAGNAAGSGAVMALCKEQYLDEIIETSNKIEVIDLACNVDFQKMFIANLNFPKASI